MFKILFGNAVQNRPYNTEIALANLVNAFRGLPRADYKGRSDHRASIALSENGQEVFDADLKLLAFPMTTKNILGKESNSIRFSIYSHAAAFHSMEIKPSADQYINRDMGTLDISFRNPGSAEVITHSRVELDRARELVGDFLKEFSPEFSEHVLSQFSTTPDGKTLARVWGKDENYSVISWEGARQSRFLQGGIAAYIARTASVLEI